MTYKNVSSNCRFGCVVIIAQRKEKVKPDLQEIVVQRFFTIAAGNCRCKAGACSGGCFRRR